VAVAVRQRCGRPEVEVEGRGKGEVGTNCTGDLWGDPQVAQSIVGYSFRGGRCRGPAVDDLWGGDCVKSFFV
jgi:hypothetical protein